MKIRAAGAMLGAMLGALLAAAPAAAQSMRDFSTSRQLHGESRLVAHLDYGAGTLRVVPVETGDLYRLRISYDADRFAPLSGFDAATGTARLGLERVSSGFRAVSNGALGQRATLALSSQVTLSLDLQLGAVEGDLELGGLRLSDLSISTGASRTTVRFSRANPGRCSGAALSAGAADITVIGLGNSHCRDIRFEGGMGKAVIDLTGSWPADARIEARMALGALTVRVPRGVGIRLTMDRFLSTFSREGWTADGPSYVSRGYARASRHIDLVITSALGGVTIEWVN